MALWGFRAKCWTGWVSGFEEKEGVMRNAMTTRAPCGAKNARLMKKMKGNLGAPKVLFDSCFGLFYTHFKLVR